MPYTTLSQGSSATITFNDAADGLEVSNYGANQATITLLSGVWGYGGSVLKHNGGRRVIQLSGAGSVQITADSGSLQYEYTDNAQAYNGAGSLTALEVSATKSLVSGAGKSNRIALLGNSITAQAQPAYGDAKTAPNWGPTVAVTAGQSMNPPSMDLTAGVKFLKYVATVSGICGATEPVWPTTVGATVADGTVTWQCQATTTTTASWGMSWWSIAQALAGQPMDEVYIVGQSGRQSDTILATLDRVLAANPDVVFFANVWENDVWPGGAPSLATISARFDAYVAAVDRVRTLQKRVIVQTVLPHGSIDAGSAFTSYAKGTGTKAWTWLNAKIREMARARQDVILFEPDVLYADPLPANGSNCWPENATTFTSESGAGQALKRTDSIHPYLAGAWQIGKALAVVLQKYFQAPARFGTAGSESSVTVNPLKGGTAGTAGTNVTGTVANGYTLNNYATTGAGTASLVARTDISGNWQRLAYTASAGADGAQLISTAVAALGTLAVGDVVQMFSEQRVLASPAPALVTGWNNVLRFQGAGSAFDASSGGRALGTADHDIGQFIAADTVFVWKTPPVPVPAGTTGLSTYPKLAGRGTAVFTVDFGRESIQRVSVQALA